MEVLIKSRARVRQFGEVFTPRWMVKKMLAATDIQAALRDPATKFLEPCCGEGAFLTEILRQKLAFAPDSSFDALRNIFGIEIQPDNLAHARKNLAQIFADFYRLDLEDSRIWQILKKNILRADVLKVEVPSLFEEVFNLSKNPLADLLKDKFGLSDAEIKNMVIISNPPYQEDKNPDGGNKNYASPVYHKFIEAFYKTSDRVMVIHPARCLFNVGATPKEFNDKFLSDEHITVPIYHINSKEVFPNVDVDIRGGVAVTYRDANKNFGAIGTFIAFEELKSIHKKVTGREDFSPFSKIVYGRTHYRLTEKFIEENPDAPFIKDRWNDFFKSNVFEYAADYFFDEKPNDGHEYIQVWGLEGAARACKWIRHDYILVENKVNFYKYKVFIPEANGSGALGEKMATMLVGSPLVGCTQTFISAGAFDTQAEAEAAMKFVKTKFARALLGILKVTQHNPTKTWEYVPMQDFSGESDIDWSRSVAEIDAQLYRKYKLDAREIAFIEEKVRAME